jgi:hypothetical protein
MILWDGQQELMVLRIYAFTLQQLMHVAGGQCGAQRTAAKSHYFVAGKLEEWKRIGTEWRVRARSGVGGEASASGN